MKKYFLFLVVFLQAAILAWLVFDRESTLLSGENVWLKTEPIDPIDPLRGQYVTLNYEISTIPKTLYSEKLLNALNEASKEEDYSYTRKNTSVLTVFVSLSLDERGIAHATAVDTEAPKDGLFLQGEINARHSWRRDTITYGIESYYVQQGKGQGMESRARDNPRSLEMNVRINKKGKAVIEGFRWSGVEMVFTQDDKENCFLTFENHDPVATAIIIPDDFSTIDFSYFSWDPVSNRKSNASTEPVASEETEPDTPKQKIFSAKDVRIIPANEELTVQIYPPFENLSRRTMTGVIRYEIPEDAVMPPLPQEASDWTRKLHTRATIQTKGKTDADTE